MYINFQQNLVKTQVITVLTGIFAKNRKLHKFATTSNNFLKSTLSDKHHLKITIVPTKSKVSKLFDKYN